MRLVYFLFYLALFNLSSSAELGGQGDGEDNKNPDNYARGDCALKQTLFEVDACYKENNDARCHNRYREKECGHMEPCLLGFEKNSEGCVVDCKCAKNGTLEGDIKIADEDDLREKEEQYGIRPQSKDASRYKKRWNNFRRSDGTCLVYFRCSPAILSNSRARRAISSAFAAFRQKTCIRFQSLPRSVNKQHLYFTCKDGCWSYIGRTNKNAQEISIGRGCEFRGIVIHEIMHAMGFFHEQSRPDRDEHVRVCFQNIIPSFKNNFRKQSHLQVDSMGSPYDVNSIMHYGGKTFSRNGRPTIIDRSTNRPVKEQRYFFSKEDLIQLNKMYDCGSKYIKNP